MRSRMYLLLLLLAPVLGSGQEALTIDEMDEEHGVDISEDFSEDHDEFIPTDEWQIIKPGQAIPAGLHVRLNMMTGDKEAKLLKEDTSTDLSVVHDQGEDTDKVDENIAADRHRPLTEAMEQVYKELQTAADAHGAGNGEEEHDAHDDMFAYWKKEDKSKQNGKPKFTKEELEEAVASFEENQNFQDLHPGKKYRSMEEIKEEFSKYEVEVQTDIEILKELFETYQQPELSDEDRITLLEDFEYYVHQVDNAVDFVTLGGLAVLAKDLNSTNSDVRSAAAFVIGSAAQSNPPVQIEIIELQLMQKLIHMVSHDPVMTPRLRALYALSATIRHFPYAQQKFIKHGGLQILHSIFSEEDTQKLQLKAITLITDLAKEQSTTEAANDEIQQEKLKQYKLVPLFEHIREQGWCDVIPPLLTSSTAHDHREKTLRAMSTLVHVCEDSFLSSINTIRTLEREYSALAIEEQGYEQELEEESDGYYQSMLDIVEQLRNELGSLQRTHSEL